MATKKKAKKAAKRSGKRGTSRRAKATPKRSARRVPPPLSYHDAATIASDPKRTVKVRVAALTSLARDLCSDGAVFQRVLDLLKDDSTPPAVRLAALQVLQAASFSGRKFTPFRPKYLAVLRSVATDRNAELRQSVLGILSREQDGRAQELLLEGLADPAKALVPPEKALQLLSYDIHAEAYPIARRIVQSPPSEAAKREALRLLAADAASKPVFERILGDKKESLEARQISASALQALAPDQLQRRAREIAVDSSEQAGLRATSLTALTYFGRKEELRADEGLAERVGRLKKSKSSSPLKRGAKRFLDEYRK
jgi:hypothetical protein